MGTDSSRARGLQLRSGMKWIAAILAAGLFVGCGVGVDDPEGLLASGYEDVGSSQQGLTAVDGAGSMDGGVGAGMGMYVPNNTLAGAGPVSSPQDPIPAFQARPLPTRAPTQQGLPLTAPSGDDPRPTK